MTSKGWNQSWAWVVLPVGIAAAVGLVLFMRWRGQESLKTEPGKAISAFLLHDQSLVVLVDRVIAGRRSKALATGYRIVELDPTSGHQVGTLILDDNVVRCWPAAGHRIWCSEAGGLLLLDTPSLATVGTIDALVASLGRPVRDRWSVEGDDVVLELADGRGVRVESATLAVHETKAGETNSEPDLRCKTQSTLELGHHDYLVFGEGPRHALLRAEQNYAKLPPAPPSAPTFLRQDMQPDFLVLPDASLSLVLSDKSLDPKADTTLLSRVDTKPSLVWTAELGGSCQHAEVVGQSLVIATTTAANRAKAFDLATGKLLWAFGF